MNRKQFSNEMAKMRKYMKYSLFTSLLVSGIMLSTSCTRDVDSVDKAEIETTQIEVTETADITKNDECVETTVDENVVDASGFIAQDYEKIITDMKEKEPVNTENESIIQMISRLTIADYVGNYTNTQLTYQDLGQTLMDRYYTIIDTARFCGLYPEFNEKQVTQDCTIRFSKDEVRKVVKDFYKYEGDLNWDASGIKQVEDDMVDFIMASGEMKNYIAGYTIRENEGYYLLSGACFDELADEWRYYTDVLLEKNSNSTLGMSFVYIKTYDEEKKVISIEATSILEESEKATYKPENLLDGNFSTAWVEGEDGVGIGTMITIKLEQPALVYGLKLYNGYQKSKDIFVKNGRVKHITVSNADNVLADTDVYYDKPYTMDTDFGEHDRPYNLISFHQPTVVDEIVITIQDACAGDKYEDTAISELVIY